MPPPPPTSTLFPYTTLFRSTPRVAALRYEQHLSSKHQSERVALAPVSENEVIDEQRAARLDRLTKLAEDLNVTDRKSTRLNSSHRCISYAVFCLKKKKIKQL